MVMSRPLSCSVTCTVGFPTITSSNSSRTATALGRSPVEPTLEQAIEDCKFRLDRLRIRVEARVFAKRRDDVVLCVWIEALEAFHPLCPVDRRLDSCRVLLQDRLPAFAIVLLDRLDVATLLGNALPRSVAGEVLRERPGGVVQRGRGCERQELRPLVLEHRLGTLERFDRLIVEIGLHAAED